MPPNRSWAHANPRCVANRRLYGRPYVGGSIELPGCKVRARGSTFGPHAIGTQRFPTVSSSTSFAQATGAILGKRAYGQNPDKDEILRITFHLFPKSPAPPAEPRALEERLLRREVGR
jgi:hypothetical protein